MGGEKVPDEKTLARVMRALGPEVVEEINRRFGADGATAAGGERAEDAGGYDGGGDEHSQSYRQQLAGGRGAGADPDDEENPGGAGRRKAASSESDAEPGDFQKRKSLQGSKLRGCYLEGKDPARRGHTKEELGVSDPFAAL